MKRRSRSILAAAAAAIPLVSAGSSVRGGRNTIANDVNVGTSAKRTRHNTKRRPVIPDAHQREKIRSWNRRQLEELLQSGQSSAPYEYEHQSHQSQGQGRQLPHGHSLEQSPNQPQHAEQRDLYAYGSHHKKSKNYGVVEAHPGQDMGFQTPATTTTTKATTTTRATQPARTTTTTTRAKANKGPNNNNNNNNNNPAQQNTASKNDNNSGNENNDEEMVSNSASAKPPNPYYPLYTSTRTIGTCSNNGNEPHQYRDRSQYFLFDTMDECCEEWYHDAAGCKEGFAYPLDDGSGELLLRNWVTGERLDVYAGYGVVKPVEDKEGDEEILTSSAIAAAIASANSKANKEEEKEEEEEIVANKANGNSHANSFASSFGGSSNNNNNPAQSDGDSRRRYYPSFNMKLYPDGACLKDGNEPGEYALEPDDYLFDTERQCCREWFLSVSKCMDAGSGSGSSGASSASPQLIEEEEDEAQQMSEKVDVVVDTPAPTRAPTKEPTRAPTPRPTRAPSPRPEEAEAGGDSPWPTWFDSNDEEELDAELDYDYDYQAKDDEEMVSTPWPTWSDAYFDEGADNQDQFSYTSSTSVPHDNAAFLASLQQPQYLFFESFEDGDFSTYDWGRPTFTPQGAYAQADPWEADRTVVAYDGDYAARPPILQTAGMQSNLTINLEGMDVSEGGYLTFAVHASVEMPVDVLYFTINHQVIRTFDSVYGEPGDWEEVSVLLLPGEHALTWSYQYHGMPGPQWESQHGPYNMDMRRMGNSWVDAIGLQAYTGDVSFSDDGEDAFVLLQSSGGNGHAWSLVGDSEAYIGAHSYIAYTDDIPGNQGSLEISWTIIAGPDGGVLSFAAYASLYAPHDTLELTVNNVPQLVMTRPSINWEKKYIAIDPGRHVVKWKLVKNPPGLDVDVMENVEKPEGYQGYVKIDDVAFTDHRLPLVYHDPLYDAKPAPTTTTTAATTTTTTTTRRTTTSATTSTMMMTTTEEPETTTTTEATTTTTEEPTTTTTTEEPTTTTEEPTTTTTKPTTTTTRTTTTTTKEPTTTTTTTTTTEEPTTTTTTTERTTTEEPTTTTTTTTTTEMPVPLVDFKVDYTCPEGLQSVQGLPGCCVEDANYLGDGACDPWAPYNTAECAFDLGDCCTQTCNQDSAYGCLTKDGDGEYGPFGWFCIDPRYRMINEERCQVENREWLGDGGCDAEGGYNTEECGWDMGDCCEETCNTEFSFYPCGSNQPYACENPDTRTNPTGSSVHEMSSSPFYFHDGFEANVFDPLRWKRNGGDAVWEIESDDPAAEGTHYAEARTEYIIGNTGTSVLELSIQSPQGGTLEYMVQTFIQVPYEDVLIEVDGVVNDIIATSMEEWTLQTLDIEAGVRRTVRWIHRKNPTDASEEELAMTGGKDGMPGITRIDDVKFLPF